MSETLTLERREKKKKKKRISADRTAASERYLSFMLKGF